MALKKNLLDNHPNKPYRGKDGAWYAYYDKGGKRKRIKRKTEAEITDALFKILRKQEDKITFADMFDDFIDRKKKIDKIKQSSIGVYQQVFDRHYVSSGWSDKDIRKVEPMEITEFLEDECCKHDLPTRSWGNLKTITFGMLRRAKRRGLINYNYSVVAQDIEVKPTKRTQSARENVLSPLEQCKLIEYLQAHKDIHNLAILVMLISGIRVGEMVALTYDDFISSTVFLVERTETKYKDKNGKWVYCLGEPKTEAGRRKVVIPEDFGWIVEEMRKLRPFATYLCTNEKGERMTTNTLRRRLNRICGWLGFDKKKSPHKLRATYVSLLLDSGVDNNMVKTVSGHTQISMSESYHGDIKSDAEKQEIINKVVNFRVS